MLRELAPPRADDREPDDFDFDRDPLDFERDPEDFAFDREPDDFDFDREPDDFDFDREPDDFAFDREPEDLVFELRVFEPRVFDFDREPADFVFELRVFELRVFVFELPLLEELLFDLEREPLDFVFDRELVDFDFVFEPLVLRFELEPLDFVFEPLLLRFEPVPADFEELERDDERARAGTERASPPTVVSASSASKEASSSTGGVPHEGTAVAFSVVVMSPNAASSNGATLLDDGSLSRSSFPLGSSWVMRPPPWIARARFPARLVCNVRRGQMQRGATRRARSQRSGIVHAPVTRARSATLSANA